MTIYLVWAMETETQDVVCGFTDKERAESFAAKLRLDFAAFCIAARNDDPHYIDGMQQTEWSALRRAYESRWLGKCPGWPSAGVYTPVDEFVILPCELDP